MNAFKHTIVLTLLLLFASTAYAQSIDTSFTYQGELQLVVPGDDSIKANGSFDFTFTLFDDSVAGTAVGDPFIVFDVAVTDGIFSLLLDFGIDPFSGDQLWLQIDVRNGGEIGSFSSLLPRQIITATPFATLTQFVVEGSIGDLEIIPSEVQLRVSGNCTAGSFVTAVNQDGTLTCTNDADEQTLSLVGTTLSLSSGNSVDIASALGDTDATNELNTGVSFDGSNLTVTDAGGNQSADISALANNDTNELNTGMGFDGSNISISDTGGSFSANLSALLDNTDSQTLGLVGTSLSVTGGNAVDLASLFNDNSTSNELNTAVSFDGTNLSVTDAGGSLSADLSGLSDTAAELLTKLATVDGASSGLDADLLDGMEASEIIAAADMEHRIEISALPFTITQAGSYIVTGDLVNTTDDTNGIRVEADNVTVDLGGHTITADMTPDDNIIMNRNGVSVALGRKNIRVINGQIDGWGADGISGSQCDGCLFSNLIITNNRFSGLEARDSTIITHVTSSLNGDHGFDIDDGCVIAFSAANENARHGFLTQDATVVINSNAYDNGQTGFDLSRGATVIASTAVGNLQYGFDLEPGSTAQSSSALDNGWNGFDVTSGFLRDNTARGNGGETTEDGKRHGYRLSSNSYAVNNYAYDNDGAGFLVAFGDAILENNVAVDNNLVGVEVISTGSLVIRNRTSGNGPIAAPVNYSIAAGNAFGPIINVEGLGDLSAVLGADHGLANLEY